MTTLSRRAEIGADALSRGLVLGWLLGVWERRQLPWWFILGLLWGLGFLAAPLGLYGDAYYRITLPLVFLAFVGGIALIVVHAAGQNRRDVTGLAEYVRKVYAGERRPPEHWDEWWHWRYEVLRTGAANPEQLRALWKAGQDRLAELDEQLERRRRPA
jgi:hypothetical protein